MAMKRLQAIIILMHLGYSIALSQRVVTIGECYSGAYTVTPLNAEKGIYERMAQLKEGSATKNWFPTVDLNGNFVPLGGGGYGGANGHAATSTTTRRISVYSP